MKTFLVVSSLVLFLRTVQTTQFTETVQIFRHFQKEQQNDNDKLVAEIRKLQEKIIDIESELKGTQLEDFQPEIRKLQEYIINRLSF